MRQITAKELQDLRPKEFEKAYYSWVNNHDYYREHMDEMFTEDVAEEGIEVDYVEMHQYNARFQGRVRVPKFMEFTKMHEKYVALYEYAKLTNLYVHVRINRYHMDYEPRCIDWFVTPTGIFKHLDEETWLELVEEESDASDYVTEIEERCNYLCGRLFKAIEEDYEDQTNVQAFIESCECNEVLFSIEEEEDEIHN